MADFSDPKNLEKLLELRDLLGQAEAEAPFEDVEKAFRKSELDAPRRISKTKGEDFILKGKPETKSGGRVNFKMVPEGSDVPAVRKATEAVATEKPMSKGLAKYVDPDIIEDVAYRSVDEVGDVAAKSGLLKRLLRTGGKVAGPTLGVVGALMQDELNPESPEEREMYERAVRRSESLADIRAERGSAGIPFAEGMAPNEATLADRNDLTARIPATPEPPAQEEVKEAATDVKLEQVNDKAKSPFMKTPQELQVEKADEMADKTLQGQLKEEVKAKKGDVDPILKEYQEAIQKYKKKLNQPKKEYGVMDALPDILAGLYNIGVRAKGGRLPEMKMPGSIQARKAAEKAARQEELGGLENLQKMYKQYVDAQKKSGDELSLRDQIYFSQAAERLELQKESLKRRDVREERLRDKFGYKKAEKFQDDARDALKDLRQTDTWKTGEKSIAEVETIEALLEDAYEKGGQSLAMLGPRVAKVIAGEVGVLTERDVVRYVQNPQVVESLMDTIKKTAEGKLTEASYENLKRLLEISKRTSKDKIDAALDREATILARREGIPYEDARYYLDNEFQREIIDAKDQYTERMLKGKEAGIGRVKDIKAGEKAEDRAEKRHKMAGKIIKSKGKRYRVAEDGETLIPLE